MEKLNRKNILPYLEKFAFPHLRFITGGKLQFFKEVGGGLVSQVYRLVVDGIPFYLKQVIPGARKYLEILRAPKDFNYIFNDERQFYEVAALRIFEKAVGYGVAPHVYYHDIPNKVLIISEVCPTRAFANWWISTCCPRRTSSWLRLASSIFFSIRSMRSSSSV